MGTPDPNLRAFVGLSRFAFVLFNGFEKESNDSVAV